MKRAVVILCGLVALTALAQPAGLKLKAGTVFGLGTIVDVQVSPDGQLVASAGGRGVVLWNAKDGSLVKILEGAPDNGALISLSWAADSKSLITGSNEGVVQSWNVSSGQAKSIFKEGYSTQVALSRNGNLIAMSSSEEVLLLDAKTGRKIWRGAFGYEINDLQFNPNSSLLAVAVDANQIQIVDIAKRKITKWAAAHTNVVNTVAFSPDGKSLASASDDSTVRVWNVSSAKSVAAFKGELSVNALAWSADGTKIVAQTDSESLKFWDVKTRKANSVKTDSYFLSLAYAPNGRVYGVSYLRALNVFDAQQKKILEIPGYSGAFSSVGFAPSGRQLTVTSDANETASLFTLDEQSANPVALLTTSVSTSRAPAWGYSPDGNTLATAGEGGVRLFEVGTGKQIALLEDPDTKASTLAWRPDNQFIATAADRELRIWDVSTGKVVATTKNHTNSINAIAFSADGRMIATVSDDGTARTYTIE